MVQVENVENAIIRKHGGKGMMAASPRTDLEFEDMGSQKSTKDSILRGIEFKERAVCDKETGCCRIDLDS